MCPTLYSGAVADLAFVDGIACIDFLLLLLEYRAGQFHFEISAGLWLIV